MVALIIIAWIACSIIAYGVWRNKEPYRTYGDEPELMGICFCLWPFLALGVVATLALKGLALPGEFAAGFMSKFMKGDKNAAAGN